MTVDTLMWIAFALVAIVCLGTIAHGDRKYRRELREAREAWEKEIDRRTR